MLLDETPLFDPSLLQELDWSSNTVSFSPPISPSQPGQGLVLRPLCTADLDRGTAYHSTVCPLMFSSSDNRDKRTFVFMPFQAFIRSYHNSPWLGMSQKNSSKVLLSPDTKTFQFFIYLRKTTHFFSFIANFEHMKKSGDYYVIVVEDTNLGQIVATATLIIEHKFIHACAKVFNILICLT